MTDPLDTAAANARVSEVEAVLDARCTARPWRSCSRPDGTPLRQWDRSYLWTDNGVSCEAGS